jgi:hypothetical protein
VIHKSGDAKSLTFWHPIDIIRGHDDLTPPTAIPAVTVAGFSQRRDSAEPAP